LAKTALHLIENDIVPFVTIGTKAHGRFTDQGIERRQFGGLTYTKSYTAPAS
jgi:hypothetical protein